MQFNGILDDITDFDWGGLVKSAIPAATQLYTAKMNADAVVAQQKAQMNQMLALQNGYAPASARSVYPAPVVSGPMATPTYIPTSYPAQSVSLGSQNLPSWLIPAAAVGAAFLLFRRRK